MVSGMSGPTPPSETGHNRWATLANGLTFARLAMAPACALAILGGESMLAFLLFWIAVATDLADGRVARQRGEASALGALLDHSTDALFVSLGLAALACGGEVPAVLPALVALAFVQYALDSRALSGRVLRSSFLGRWNGILYFVLLGVPVVRDGLALGWPPAAGVLVLGWLLVASTLISMLDRGQAWVATRRSRE
jgi:phosphatidylglycerophosphate synthase